MIYELWKIISPSKIGKLYQGTYMNFFLYKFIWISNLMKKNPYRFFYRVHLSWEMKGFSIIHILWWKILPIKINEYLKLILKFSSHLLIFKYQSTYRSIIYTRVSTINFHELKFLGLLNGQVVDPICRICVRGVVGC